MLYKPGEELIEWCTRTDNIVEGCSIAAPECENCYAMDLAARFSQPGKDGRTPHYEGIARVSDRRGLPMWTGKVRLRPDILDACIRQLFLEDVLQRSFWVSMGDLFHAEVPDSYLDEAFGGAALVDQHVIIMVTKRADRAAHYTNAAGVEERVRAAAQRRWEVMARTSRKVRARPFAWRGWPLRNVHLMASAGSQATADMMIPHLVEARVGLTGISVEPLIASVRFDRWLDKIGWQIIGGESGRRARPCELAWMEEVIGPAQEHGGPRIFVKQMGLHIARKLGMKREVVRPKTGKRVMVLDRKGKVFDLFPAHLRIRQFPDPQPVGEAA